MPIHFPLPTSSQLNIAKLSHLFDDTSASYKFFWFQAILNALDKRNCTINISASNSLSFEDIINEMICTAYYMVTEYHLRLGHRDNLENIIALLHSYDDSLKPNSKPQEILAALNNFSNDEEVRRLKNILTLNVPYRLQAPFLQVDYRAKNSNLIRNINLHEGLIYKFGAFDGLNTKICLDDAWADYLTQHREILSGWLKYNLINYLERRNPGVPGIINKLNPPEKRDLKKVTDFWKTVMKYTPIYEIYDLALVDEKNLSIDHFVPWSYVSHDELWNLSPTTKSINSSKSNNLPEWNNYFGRLCEVEYQAYELSKQRIEVKQAFDKCADDHINDENVRRLLYKDGLSQGEFACALENIMRPVYDSCVRAGFTIFRP